MSSRFLNFSCAAALRGTAAPQPAVGTAAEPAAGAFRLGRGPAQRRGGASSDAARLRLRSAAASAELFAAASPAGLFAAAGPARVCPVATASAGADHVGTDRCGASWRCIRRQPASIPMRPPTAPFPSRRARLSAGQCGTATCDEPERQRSSDGTALEFAARRTRPWHRLYGAQGLCARRANLAQFRAEISQ